MALLLAGLAMNFVLSIYHTAGRATVRDGLHSKASVVMTRIIDELRECTAGSVATSPVGLALTPLESTTSTGQKVWAEYSSFYFWSEPRGELFYRKCPPYPSGTSWENGPTRYPAFEESDLSSLFNPDGERAVGLCGDVKKFAIHKDGSLVWVTLILERQSVHERLESFRISRALKLRNS